MNFSFTKAALLVAITFIVCGCGLSKKAKNTTTDAFTVEQMIKNYEDNLEGIQGVIEYAANSLNDHCGLQLILNQSGISEFYVNSFMWLGTDNPKQADFDKLMPLVGLTQEGLDTIVAKLRSVNCLSVELMKSGSQFAKVLYWENDACRYYYHIYYEPLTDAELTEMTKEMDYCIPYNNKMFLEHNPKQKNADATFPERDIYMKDLHLPKR